ncbi:MAG: hypothetical protein ACLGHY_10945 [Gammaproteobacteria bacterium]
MSRVIVHIDRLVLRGIQAEDRHRIAAGLQQALKGLFADRGAMPRLKAIADAPGLKVSGVRVAHRSAPVRLGEAVGRGIGKEMLK